ncbi:hypothetical protein BDN70DRAFT_887009 [Pholiota conissans]|uniref:Uncharacterized protein n=1 Tax=Pholiota conissans TaxID=109636 RepID=A0A9P6CML7_9AGAR|nr:hypothetical protein BDN70DRAFT_887009 [Pholiota conissans]
MRLVHPPRSPVQYPLGLSSTDCHPSLACHHLPGLCNQHRAVFEECKLLIWADSLLKASYDYMSDFMSKEPIPPPFPIHQFRFIAAGMALALKSLDNTGPSPTTSRAAYLLEEVLPGKKTEFVKYLHNAKAISDLSPIDPDYHLAEFLMFI